MQKRILALGSAATSIGLPYLPGVFGAVEQRSVYSTAASPPRCHGKDQLEPEAFLFEQQQQQTRASSPLAEQQFSDEPPALFSPESPPTAPSSPTPSSPLWTPEFFHKEATKKAEVHLGALHECAPLMKSGMLSAEACHGEKNGPFSVFQETALRLVAFGGIREALAALMERKASDDQQAHILEALRRLQKQLQSDAGLYYMKAPIMNAHYQGWVAVSASEPGLEGQHLRQSLKNYWSARLWTMSAEDEALMDLLITSPVFWGTENIVQDKNAELVPRLVKYCSTSLFPEDHKRSLAVLSRRLHLLYPTDLFDSGDLTEALEAAKTLDVMPFEERLRNFGKAFGWPEDKVTAFLRFLDNELGVAQNAYLVDGIFNDPKKNKPNGAAGHGESASQHHGASDDGFSSGTHHHSHYNGGNANGQSSVAPHGNESFGDTQHHNGNGGTSTTVGVNGTSTTVGGNSSVRPSDRPPHRTNSIGGGGYQAGSIGGGSHTGSIGGGSQTGSIVRPAAGSIERAQVAAEAAAKGQAWSAAREAAAGGSISSHGAAAAGGDSNGHVLPSGGAGGHVPPSGGASGQVLPSGGPFGQTQQKSGMDPLMLYLLMQQGDKKKGQRKVQKKVQRRRRRGHLKVKVGRVDKEKQRRRR